MLSAAAMLLALAIEALVGWPAALHARIGHPVTWMGRLIGWADRRFNIEGAGQGARRLAGVLVVLALCGATWALAAGLVALLPGGWIGVALTGLLAFPLVATRSLFDHVRAVAIPLRQGDLARARQSVAMIVGRDPNRLDTPGVGRAALESLAESTSDGVVAPVFWGLLLGLPGIATYKMINTMDSMIGHLTPRHAAFGWAAARLDDLVNLLPARLSGLLIVLVSGRIRDAFSVMMTYGAQHRSPNAGWPEAALAGALNLRLSGPRVYDGAVTDEPWVNGGAPDPAPQDLGFGLEVYLKAMALMAAGLAVLAVLG
jgi:adenosylcobinamide-phosphate synthase